MFCLYNTCILEYQELIWTFLALCDALLGSLHGIFITRGGSSASLVFPLYLKLWMNEKEISGWRRFKSARLWVLSC